MAYWICPDFNAASNALASVMILTSTASAYGRSGTQYDSLRPKLIEVFGCQPVTVNGPVPTNLVPVRSSSMVSESRIGTVSSRSKMLPSWWVNPSTIVCSSEVSKEVTAAAVLRSCAVHSGSA